MNLTTLQTALEAALAEVAELEDLPVLKESPGANLSALLFARLKDEGCALVIMLPDSVRTVERPKPGAYHLRAELAVLLVVNPARLGQPGALDLDPLAIVTAIWKATAKPESRGPYHIELTSPLARVDEGAGNLIYETVFEADLTAGT